LREKKTINCSSKEEFYEYVENLTAKNFICDYYDLILYSLTENTDKEKVRLTLNKLGVEGTKDEIIKYINQLKIYNTRNVFTKKCINILLGLNFESILRGSIASAKLAAVNKIEIPNKIKIGGENE